MEKLLKVKDIINNKIEKNRRDIQNSVERIAKARKEMTSLDIRVRRYNSLNSEIRLCEKVFDEASTQNRILTTVLYIINNVLNEKEE